MTEDRRGNAPGSDLPRSKPCECRFLQREADEPRSPVVFDQQLNEYHIAHAEEDGRHGFTMIYHCPWCGGAAPESKRGALFAHITNEESRRLHELTANVRSLADAIAAFGLPTADQHNGLGTHSPESDEKPAEVTSFRVLIYTTLSGTADVRFTDYGPERGVRMSLVSKYIGGKTK